MPLPNQTEWHFADIGKSDPARAARLECAPGFDEILSLMEAALTRSLAREQFFFGVEGTDNQRVTLQFGVGPQLYDAFFNARSGYRAHYWASPECGQKVNASLLHALWKTLSAWLPEQVGGRAIEVREAIGRVDVDTGGVIVPRSLLQASFAHAAAKVWVCERQMRGVEGPSRPIREALEGLPLSVAGWKTRAPLPNGSTWLDVKGGFVKGPQPKDPMRRARDIHQTGWS